MIPKSLLFLSTFDYVVEPNHRTHHVVRYIRTRVPRCMVLHYVHTFSRAFGSRLKDLVTIRWPIGWRDGVVCVGVDHMLNHSDSSTLTLLGLRELSELRRSRARQVVYSIVFSLGGALNDLSYMVGMLGAYFVKVGGRYDVCVAEGPLEGFVGLILKALGRVRVFVYEDVDNFSGRMTSLFRRSYTARGEAFCVAHADAVISVGIMLAEDRKVRTGRVVKIIPNGVDTALFRRGMDRTVHPPTILYTGAVHEWSGIDKAMEAMGFLRTKIPDLRLLVVGRSRPEYEQKLCEQAEQLGLTDRVRFFGSREYAELADFHREGDVGLALFEPNEFRKYASPLKVFEYAAGGLPVIGTRGTETEAILDRYGFGMAVDFDAQALARCLDVLFSDRERYQAYAAKARECAPSFDWQRLMEDEFRHIVQVYSCKMAGSNPAGERHDGCTSRCS